MLHTHRKLAFNDLAKLLAENISLRKYTLPSRGEILEIPKTFLVHPYNNITAFDDAVVLKRHSAFTYLFPNIYIWRLR